MVNMKSLLRHGILAMMSVLVMGTGEWSEDAEDLGKLIEFISYLLFLD